MRPMRPIEAALYVLPWLVPAIANATAPGHHFLADHVETAPQVREEVVVLVHGLGRTPLSMLPLAWALNESGYEVVNWGYSSLCCDIDELARQLAAELEEGEESEAPRVHFVSHSLGGIIIRSMLAADPPVNLGRIVMIAPPNRGSRTADRYEPLLGWLFRPLDEITTTPDNPVFSLRLPPGVEVGVIAGSDDAKVSLSETRLDGPHDFAVVPSAHTFIMARGDVHDLVTRFLRTGDFGPPESADPLE